MPILVGHRGIGNPWAAQLRIPEESIPAIQYAASHHADMVEGDVQNSSDGTMYMMHDETLERTTNGTGYTTARRWSYIKELWLEIPVDTNGNGDDDNTKHHPPSFRAWLAAASPGGEIRMPTSARQNQPGSSRLCSMGHLSMTRVKNCGCYLNRRDLTCRTQIGRCHVT